MTTQTIPESFTRFDAVLRFAAARGISDVHFKAGQMPLYRRHGQLSTRQDEAHFSDHDLHDITGRLLEPAHEGLLLHRGMVAFTHELVGGGRFRITVLRQRGQDALAVRVLPTKAPTWRDLRLPPMLAQLALLPSGLVLVAGAPGSGRTSLWAALLEHLNTAAPSPRHVVTVEQAIEVPFDDKHAFVRQREIGIDVPDVQTALAQAMRQDVDVVAVEPLTSTDLHAALDVADQGRLVLAVVPGAGPVEALRILLANAGEGARLRLASQLRAVVSQTLVPGADGKGRVPAMQVLLSTPSVLELLRGHLDLEALRHVMEQGRTQGMTTLDQSLADLVATGGVTLEAALAVAHQPEQLRTRTGQVRA